MSKLPTHPNISPTQMHCEYRMLRSLHPKYSDEEIFQLMIDKIYWPSRLPKIKNLLYPAVREEIAEKIVGQELAQDLLNNKLTIPILIKYLKYTGNYLPLSRLRLLSRSKFYETVDYVLTNFNDRCVQASKEYYDHYFYNYQYGSSCQDIVDLLEDSMVASFSFVYGYGDFIVGDKNLSPIHSFNFLFPVRINIIRQRFVDDLYNCTGGTVHLMFHRTSYCKNKYDKIRNKLRFNN